jgi:GH15 family glucan-1,4-alpha-glucosidase
MEPAQQAYPPIADYALITNCQCAALISRAGSVDWCCMPRIDSDSCFGRLLDWGKGGHCAVLPLAPDAHASRRYLPGTMVLETRYRTADGEVLVHDFFVIDTDNDRRWRRQERPRMVRLVRGVAGRVRLRIEVVPRFDYGAITPHVSRRGDSHVAIGSNVGLCIECSAPLQVERHRQLAGEAELAAGDCLRLAIGFHPPECLDEGQMPAGGAADADFDATCAAWHAWSSQVSMPFGFDQQTLRSAVVLKSLSCERSGAIAAAPTTSLPEWFGGERNWEYRYSWVRDSVFTVRALHGLGCHAEADAFLRFIQRSSAGSAEELQIMYAVDGKRRLTEVELKYLEGYRGARPVRIGNRAARQNQLDVYGELLELAWEWHAGGRRIDTPYWAFLTDAVNAVCREWRRPDYGIWEFRGGPRHYVHSKAMCWGAVEHGIRLAREQALPAPLADWTAARDEIRAAVEGQGYDAGRGCFVQAFGNSCLDSALLLLPRIGIVAHDDPRMVRTVDALCEGLDQDGLLLRYRAPDGLPGAEGAFLPCTFWLASCLALQGRRALAWEYYRRALGCANDLGLFAEEFDTGRGEMLGNFPQALTHVSQIMARLALGSEPA